jgi:nitroreductase
MDLDLATVDHLLTTTRSVRKRLDFARPVERSVIERCIEIATQAPSASNSQRWHFVVVMDAGLRARAGEVYRRSFALYAEGYREQDQRDRANLSDPRAAQLVRMRESAQYLGNHMGEAPALVIPCIEGRVENAGPMAQAATYGSILPAAWSFMLALRARGLGTAWTTLHLRYEQEVAAILGIPDTITQAALMPVAYYTGGDFKLAARKSIAELVHWDTWK